MAGAGQSPEDVLFDGFVGGVLGADEDGVDDAESFDDDVVSLFAESDPVLVLEPDEVSDEPESREADFAFAFDDDRLSVL